MILLDTNVISETMRPQPNPKVLAWLDAQAAETLYLSSVTIAELLFGLAALPNGKRKQNLQKLLDKLVGLFSGRVLDFDVAAAQHYANLAIVARSNGRGFPTPDGYIAAIAAAHNFIIASRDTAPYLAAQVTVINPWEEESAQT